MKSKEIKNIILNNKKWIAIVIVSVVVISGVGLKLTKGRNTENLEKLKSEISNETVKLKRGNLNKLVIVSGKVESGEVSNVSSTLAAKVKSINVNVGDTVKAGDVICVLDDSNIVKEIESKSKAIEEERKTLQDNYNRISNQLEELRSTHAEVSRKQNNEIEIASSNLNKSNAELSNYESTFNNIKNTYNTMINGIKDKQTNYDNAESNKNKCYEAWIKSGGRVDSPEYKKYIEASENLNKKQEELNKAKELYDYDNISNKYNEVLTIYNEKVSVRDAAKVQHNEAVSNSISSNNANRTEVEALQTSINDINKQIKNLDNNEELKVLKENLSKTVLKAETSGKITDLKVNVGSMAEGIIGTIQSTDNLILKANIPEYDINKVRIGMKARIISNSSSNKVNGELIRISPVASNDEKGGFSADIAIERGSGLFIETNGKAEIIISDKGNVILAPIDSIKDIDSNPKILVKERDDEYREVPITIGEKDDYYIEVSGDNIKEGMEIKANANDDSESYLDSGKSNNINS